MSDVLVVWLHGSEGWRPRGKGDAWRDAWLWDRGAAVVHPAIPFDVTFTADRMEAETAKDCECLQVQIDYARERHGYIPTVYAGFSRGGLLAVYAAQRDKLKLARYVVNVAGTVAWGAPDYMAEAGRVLAMQAKDNPPGVWLYGKADKCAPVEQARQGLHAAAGKPQDFEQVPDMGHEWPVPRARQAIIKGIEAARAGAEAVS